MVYIARSVHYKSKVSQLKIQNSQVFYGDDEYNVVPQKHFPYFTLAEAAERLDIRKQRLSRMLRILQVPIHKIGTLVLLDDEALSRIKAAVKQHEVRRGRKPNVE